MTADRRKALVLAGLLLVFALILLRDRLPWPAKTAGAPEARRGGSVPANVSKEPDWDGLIRVAGAAPAAGLLDPFSPGRTRPPPADGSPGSGGKGRQKKVKAEPPPDPEPPPPDPAQVQLESARAELSGYRFIGVFRKDGGRKVAFFSKGNDVVPLRAGESFGRTVQVVEIRETDMLVELPPDRRIRVPLKGNEPLTLP